MKYRTVSIESFNGRFKAYSVKSNLSGKDLKTSPDPTGFYHYSETITYEKAFAKLKECMIESREQEIRMLIKDLNEIKELQI